jgi:hypothetical protein
MMWLKSYARGFGWGLVGGAAFVSWVYWVAQQFPGDPSLNHYYAYIRAIKVVTR